MNGGPTRGGVAATEEFLVYRFVARTAIAGGQMCTDSEAMMIDFLLFGSWLVAVKAIDAPFRMSGHFVFVHNRVLKPSMTLRALSRRSYEVGGRLRGFNVRTLPIDKKRRQNQRKRDYD
jgi:hypothetical protein